MIEIKRSLEGDVITVILNKNLPNRIETLREAIKILTREVVKYEHGIDPDITW